MTDIYSRAESVAIFLGRDAGKDVNTPAGRLMQRLCNDRFCAGRAVFNNWGGDFDFDRVCDLFEQPYWSRIWVIQEVLLARKGDIILGNATVPLREFIENFMKKLPETLECLPLWMYSVGGFRLGDLNAFLNLMELTSTSKASDERDMIFALFGLVQGASLDGLVANYSKTMTEIYTGLAAYFLILHGQSGLLKAAASVAASDIRFAPAATSWKNRKSHPRLASWIPFARFPDLSESESYQHSLTFDEWYQHFTNMGRRPEECFHLTAIQPRGCEQPQTPLSTYKVFGNHGTLLIRASPVVHIASMGSALSHGAFTLKRTYSDGCCTLAFITTRSPMSWELWVHTGIRALEGDDWIVEAPGCDTFLHLKPSLRVPGTYNIASLSFVLLASNHHTPNFLGAIGPIQKSRPWFEDELFPDGDASAHSRLWMPLVSCGLHHLLFLRQWESKARMDRLVAPRQRGPEDSLAELSPEVLEKYGRWLELNSPQWAPSSGDGLQYEDFDSVLATVSRYLERWDDSHLWSRIYDIVIGVPWQVKLGELDNIKADAWHYLATTNLSKVVNGESQGTVCWKQRLQDLLDDLVTRLPDIPLQISEVGPSLGNFMSKDTCLSLRNSIENVPDSWTMDEIRSNEAEILKDWIEVKLCWEFMEQSKDVCLALQGKFVQLCALKRLCRRYQRDFLIC